MTDQNKMLVEELEKRLLWYREEASADEFDADEVDAICTMLLKLSPENRPRRTKEEAYRNILQQIDLEEEHSEGEEAEDEASADSVKMSAGNVAVEKSAGEDSRKKRRFFTGKRGLRAAVILLVAAGALTSLNMVSYARENKSLFTIILQRVGWLNIRKDVTAENVGIGSTLNIENFYDSWAELDPEIKGKIKVPGYIPDGYSLYGIKCWNFDDRENVQAEYYDQGNGHLLVEITLWENNDDHYRETLADEQIYTLLSEYSKENLYYYEYEDEYICIVFMENISYRIEGNIALEEMIKIGESL